MDIVRCLHIEEGFLVGQKRSSAQRVTRREFLVAATGTLAGTIAASFAEPAFFGGIAEGQGRSQVWRHAFNIADVTFLDPAKASVRGEILPSPVLRERSRALPSWAV